MTINEVCEKFDISQDTLRYYERVGAIPPVGRTKGGIRDYQEDDLNWINTAKCLRNAGMSIKAIVDYVKLYQMGEETYKERLELLKHECNNLMEQKQRLEATISLLNYKISRYEIAVATGILSWEEESENGVS